MTKNIKERVEEIEEKLSQLINIVEKVVYTLGEITK